MKVYVASHNMTSGSLRHRLGVVTIFKGAVQLEINRRENDGRVLTLMETMTDMMETLRMYVVRMLLYVAANNLTVCRRLNQIQQPRIKLLNRP